MPECDGVVTFSSQVRKEPAGEKQHKAMVWETLWRAPVYRKTRRPTRPTRPFGGEGWACEGGISTQPRKCTNRSSLELDIPQPTVRRILRKRLQVKPYRLQLLQALTDEDKTRCLQFCTDMLQHLGAIWFCWKTNFQRQSYLSSYHPLHHSIVMCQGIMNNPILLRHNWLNIVNIFKRLSK
jgi:hypothetical protein